MSGTPGLEEVLPPKFHYRLDLAPQVTPRLLRQMPIHRWFYFQHSFSPQLVDHLIDTFQLQPGALLVDPFVGAGTTLAAARQRGMNAIGVDLSPLSVLVSNAKVGQTEETALRSGLESVMTSLRSQEAPVDIERPSRLKKAFTDREFEVLKRCQQAILCQPEGIRAILLLALLRVARSASRAVPDGGWFRWRELPSSESSLTSRFREVVEEMLVDIRQAPQATGHWKAYKHDARSVRDLVAREPMLLQGCDAIISSPPYPNRHDYSRIHQIELLMLGMTEEEIFRLRRSSLRSHVEARHTMDTPAPYASPDKLKKALGQLPRKGLDLRVRSMLDGYFQDLAAVLSSCHELLKPGGHLALVVGNVRHGGVMIPVDEILQDLGEAAGLTSVAIWVARLRGNSAQQMGKFGRQPSRESVILFRQPL